ncbi:MAG: SDR family NAD(P)-dependent oxidoreductase, partial [Alphaproteobacteria bacterium]|nr:SDR family NAD(P)-dependent oxidoreductase [Alphaproteobacteria bacterium]
GGGGGLPPLDMPALPAYEMAAAPSPVMAAAPMPAPVPVPVPVAVAPAPVAPAASTDLKGLLLRLVSERTGYPEDMLGLDQDLEADLGIDSIKRAEIIGAFRKAAPAPVAQVLQANSQTFLGMGTLGAILAKLGADAPFEGAGEGTAETACAPLPRYLMRAHAEPADGVRRDPVSGLHLITPDGAGLAERLAARIGEAGGIAAIAPAEALLDPAKMTAWVESLGPARAVLHLAPLAPPEADDGFAAWRRRMAHDVKSLFALLRAAAPGLMEGGRIVSASAMGGFFGRDFPGSGARRLSPGGGGLVGLIKALGVEWRQARTKAVDLDPGEGSEAWLDHLMDELTLPGGRREVGYPCGARTVFRTEPASIDPLADPPRRPDADWVVLAIGGARGITAETLRELAAFKPTLVLVGRGAMPAPEGDSTRGLDGQALKRHFLDEARALGDKPRPVEIDARVAAVLRDREMLAVTAEFAAMGARIDHRACDMRDEAQVGALLSALYEAYGRIDAVLFGAGIIEDALLVKKTPDSLDRVFDTKVDAAWLLARGLRADSLRFVAFFTSVAGRYGNAGQTDYAAANETLNRFAWMLQAQWGPGVKVSAINWGPWEPTTHGLGMVTPETKRQFEERGVRLVDPEGGRRFLLHEILHAPTGEVEVIAGLSPWEYMEAEHGALPFPPDGASAPPAHPPALWGARVVSAEGERRLLRHRIDLVNQPWLDDHRLDGQPVMPFAGALETMAEAVEALGWGRVIEMRQTRMMRGIVLDGPGLAVEIRTRRIGAFEIGVELVAMGEEKPRYRGTAILGERFPDPPIVAVPGRRGPRPPSSGHIYNRWLFHGPLLQSMREVLALDGAGMVVRCRPGRVREFLPPAGPDSRFIFDIALIDGAMQSMSAWARANQNGTALPPALASARRFGEEPLPDELILALAVATPPDEPSILTSVSIVDGQGRLRLLLDGLEAVATRDLNLLSGGWAGGIRESLA